MFLPWSWSSQVAQGHSQLNDQCCSLGLEASKYKNQKQILHTSKPANL